MGRRRQKQSAYLRFVAGFKVRALSCGQACYTGLAILCGGVVLLLAALVKATITLLKLSFALFPVTGPLLQVYLQLAICWKATELVAPTLRPGLDEAWLAACGTAVGEWLILHALSVVLQVLTVRRLARQRLRYDDEDDDEDEYDDSDAARDDADEEDLDVVRGRNAA